MGDLTTTPAPGGLQVEPASRAASGAAGDGIASVLAFLGMPEIISFAGGFPDPETFPRERVATLFEEFAASGEATAFQYAPTRGLAGTLDVLAGRLEAQEGTRPADEELVVTSGAIEALELITKSFLDPGDLVVVEGPTYLGAIQAFRSFEAALEAVPLDEGGLDVEELERRVRAGLRPKLLYTIPDHQNPAGVTLAADRRGDVYKLQGKKEQARAEYIKAYKDMDEQAEYRRLIEVKLTALGVDTKQLAPVAPAAAPAASGVAKS